MLSFLHPSPSGGNRLARRSSGFFEAESSGKACLRTIGDPLYLRGLGLVSLAVEQAERKVEMIVSTMGGRDVRPD